jgi:hypothetical protein
MLFPYGPVLSRWRFKQCLSLAAPMPHESAGKDYDGAGQVKVDLLAFPYN